MGRDDEPIYRYEDQDGPHDFTRAQILALYFPYWSEQMRRVGKGHLVSEDTCIDDWIVVHWAWKIDGPE